MHISNMYRMRTYLLTLEPVAKTKCHPDRVATVSILIGDMFSSGSSICISSPSVKEALRIISIDSRKGTMLKKVCSKQLCFEYALQS